MQGSGRSSVSITVIRMLVVVGSVKINSIQSASSSMQNELEIFAISDLVRVPGLSSNINTPYTNLLVVKYDRTINK